ncbi:hypothetical protein [Streptomyces mirabilis]|uniref:hypothetical protein n=1 Tax=Streptomyces mirabilis TaxID=68239 RepID=UPI0036C15660
MSSNKLFVYLMNSTTFSTESLMRKVIDTMLNACPSATTNDGALHRVLELAVGVEGVALRFPHRCAIDLDEHLVGVTLRLLRS